MQDEAGLQLELDFTGNNVIIAFYFLLLFDSNK